MSSDIKCPFCGEGDFDLVGLKNHLLMGGISYPPCQAFVDTISIEEERELRKIKRDNEAKHG